MRSFLPLMISAALFWAPLAKGAGEASYMSYAQELLAREKSLANAQLQLKLTSIKSTQVEYLKSLASAATLSSAAVVPLTQQIRSILAKYEDPDLLTSSETYRVLIQDRSKVVELARAVRYHLGDTQDYLGSIINAPVMDQKICQDFANSVDVSNLKALPINSKVQDVVAFTRNSSVFVSGDQEGTGTWMFTSDPVVEGTAIFVAGAEVVGGVIWYLVSGGSLSSLFSTTAAAITISGPAAGFVIVGVLVVMAAASIATWYRNGEAKKKQEREHQQELAKFNAARDYFNSHRIKADEYRKLALESCNSQTMAQTIGASSTQIESLKADARVKSISFQGALHDLDKTLGGFEGFYNSFYDKVVKSYSLSLIKAIQDEELPVATAKAMWSIYNDSIKPKFLDAKLRLATTDCDKGKEIVAELKMDLTFQLEVIGLMATSESLRSDWSAIKQRATAALQAMFGRFDGCPATNHEIAALAPL